MASTRGAAGFTSVGGFIPWNWKYTDAQGAGGKHGGVPTEWEYAAILSAHNAIMDADALGIGALSNATVYAQFPLKDHYAQTPPTASPALEDKTYVLVYMGDYDSAAWLARSVPSVWDDPARGSVPIACRPRRCGRSRACRHSSMGSSAAS